MRIKTWVKCVYVLVFASLPGFFGLARDTEETAFAATYEPNMITLQPTDDFQSFTLRVVGPQGLVYSRSYDGAEIPVMDLFDEEGSLLVDGLYNYEIVVTPRMHDALKFVAVEERGLEATASIQSKVESGTFRIFNGAFVSPNEEEFVVEHPMASGEARPFIAGKSDPVNDSDTRDQVILDDLIVDGSACIGFDCVNGESFGFDTIRLKENNLRIKFDDTSAAASFPGNDWQLTANDSANGGANKFSIDDISGGRTPFTIEANAPSHSLFVDDGGRLGLGTSIPVVDIHSVSGNTPTLRLEQNGSSGFAPQTWDVAGNETNFFVRDATNGSALPIRLRPGADSNSLFIDSDSDVGIGTASPQAKLHVASGDARVEGSVTMEAQDISLTMTDTNTTDGSRYFWTFTNQGQIRTRWINTRAANPGDWDFALDAGNFYFFQNGKGYTAHALDIYGNGNMTIAGTLTENSDVNDKENIEAIDPRLVLDSLLNIPIATWNYSDTCYEVKHMGPMAQDFYEAFGLNGRDDGIAGIDTSGVALAAIQGLAQVVEEKNAEISVLKQQLADKDAELEARVRKLEALLLNK